ncbi:hypothetical protein [Streptomyces sp. x-80]|uniref:hypothetical protein n=1 Tax=Streptomyces sp. x-80 TaxID=2789282 RepID=UPI003980E641
MQAVIHGAGIALVQRLDALGRSVVVLKNVSGPRTRGCVTDFYGPGYDRTGFYGLRDGRVAAFAVHHTPGPALPTDPRATLPHHYSGLGWITTRARGRCPPSGYVDYDQVARADLPAWSRGRVTLVGDACQAVYLPADQMPPRPWPARPDLQSRCRRSKSVGAHQRYQCE